jgi:hypothetical protein
MSKFRDSGYVSIRQSFNEWWLKPSNKPILDRQDVAYAWIIKESSPQVDPALVYYPEEIVKERWEQDPSLYYNYQPKEEDNGDGETVLTYPLILDQDYLQPIKEMAIDKLIEFYNKEDDDGLKRDWVRPILRENSKVKGAWWSERPDPGGAPPISFYCTVGAKAFDDILPLGTYKLTTLSSGDTLNKLEDDFKEYFEVVDGSDAAKRARISEILKANGVLLDNLSSSTDVTDWIQKQNEPVFNYDDINNDPQYDENGDVWTTLTAYDPALLKPPSTFFSQGAQIYLPNPEPPQPPSPAHLISLPIRLIDPWIKHLTERNVGLLDIYKDQVKLAGKMIENFDFDHQRELLDNFDSALRQHLSFNDYEKKDVLGNRVEIFFNSEYKVIYMALDVAGYKISLPKGLSALQFDSPFGNLRTMALISKLDAIQQITLSREGVHEHSPSTGYEEFFVGPQLMPADDAMIEPSGDSDSDTATPPPPPVRPPGFIIPRPIIRSLIPSNPFDQARQKTLSIAEELAKKFDKHSTKTDSMLDTEDESIGNILNATAVGDQAASDVTFSGDLIVSNLSGIQMKIGMAGGGAAAINAAYMLLLNKLSVDNLMKAAIECLKAQIPFDCEDVVKAILETDLDRGYLFFKYRLRADLQILADEAYQESNGDAEEFSVILEGKLEVEGSVSYDDTFEEVCAEITSILLNPEKIFDIPLMAFPDNLPTVDLMGSISIMLNSAIIELITSLIMTLVSTLIDNILENCSSVVEVFADNDFGTADIAAAIAQKMGDNSLEAALAAFLDSLSPTGEIDLVRLGLSEQELDSADVEAPEEEEDIDAPPECPEGMTWNEEIGKCESYSFIDSIVPKSTVTTQFEKEHPLAQKVAAAKNLIDDLSAILTPIEIVALFEDRAAGVVYDAILRVIEARHEELHKVLRTHDDIRLFFRQLAPIVDIGAITEVITTVTNKAGLLGCTYDSTCERIANLNVNFDVGPIVTQIVEEQEEKKREILVKLIGDYITPPPSPEDPGIDIGDDQTDTFCQEGKNKSGKALIPKDNASLIFLLGKVVDIMYDGTYMSFDQEISKIADSMNVIESIPKVIPRVLDMEKGLKFDVFSMHELRTEEYIMPIPDWMSDHLPGGKTLNPEFRRLLATGFVPPQGEEDGKYGPYTTLKATTEQTAMIIHAIAGTLGVAGAATAGVGGTMMLYGAPLAITTGGSSMLAGGSLAALGAGMGLTGFLLEMALMMGMFKTDVIAPDVRYDEKIPKFAGTSRKGFNKISEIVVLPRYEPGTDARWPIAINLSLSQPMPSEPGTSPSFRASNFVMKFMMGVSLSKESRESERNPQPSDPFSTDSTIQGMGLYENKFILRIGDLPLDVSNLIVPQPGHELAYEAGSPLFLDQDQPSMDAAIFRSKYYGSAYVPEAASHLIKQIEQEKRSPLTSPGRNPQIDVLTEFIESIFRKGGLDEESDPHSRPNLNGDTRKLAQFRMVDDMTTQIMTTIGREILKSPLFLKTEGTSRYDSGGLPISTTEGISYVRLIDWAPITTPDQRACGFDPHILALDTIKKRTREDYENMIECSPLEDEISVAGLGRPELSALEAASMTGCVMTTLRTYALEQLVRAMFPLSVFVGREAVTKLLVEFITEETLEKIKDKEEKYYEEFLIQVENSFASRMNEFSPYGYVPDIVQQSREIGLDWLYADSAIKEFNGEYTGEEIDEEQVDAGVVNPPGPPSCPDTGEDSSTQAAEDESLEKLLMSETEQRVRSRLRFLVEEQIYSVLVKLQDMICFGNTLSFDDNFLARQLPLVPVQKFPGEARFAEKKFDLETMEQVEIARQFQEYSTQWALWAAARPFAMVGGSIQSIRDAASATGTSMLCVGEALSFDIPEIPDPPEMPSAEELATEIDFTLDNVANFYQTEDADGTIKKPESADYSGGILNQSFLKNLAKWELDKELEYQFDRLAGGGLQGIKDFEDSAAWDVIEGLVSAANVVGANIDINDISLSGIYTSAVSAGLSTYNEAVNAVNEAESVFDSFMDNFDVMGTLQEAGSCIIQGAEGVKDAGLQLLRTTLNSPTPFSEFAKGRDVGTTDRMGNITEFGARVQTEPGEGRFDNPIASNLTDKTGMLMLEKYIKVKTAPGANAVLNLQALDEPSSIVLPPPSDSPQPLEDIHNDSTDSPPEDAVNWPPSDSTTSDTGTPPQAYNDSTVDSNIGDSAADDSSPAGVVEGNNYVVSTFGTLDLEGSPFAGSQDRMHNPSLSQILGPREVINTSRRLDPKKPIDTAPKTVDLIGNKANVSLVPSTSPHREKIYNIDKWQEIFQQLATDNPDAKFNDYFEEWSYGTRLVYIAPTNDFQVVSETSEPGTQVDRTIKIPQSPLGDANPVRYLFDKDLSIASNAYMQYERTTVREKVEAVNYKFYHESQAFRTDGIITIEEQKRNEEVLADLSEQSLIDIIATGAEDLSKLTFDAGMIENPYLDTSVFESFFGRQFRDSTKESVAERALTVIPLSSVEIPIDFPDPNIPLSKILGYDGLSLEPSPDKSADAGTAFKDLDELYTRRFMSKTLNLLKGSPGYKLALKYCVPGNTLLSFATIYANLLSELPETFFDQTKFELKNLFEILLNGGDYTFEGATEKEKGSNREQMALAQSNMGTDGGARKPGLVDLAIQTPKLIFKGLAEFADPVIAPAALIAKKAKGGEFFPRMMKNGDVKGTWYMLPIELNQYDMPPPIGTVDDPTKTVSYINEEESRIIIPEENKFVPGLPDNINLSVPVPAFMDKITGKDLDGFLKDYFFKLGDNGNAQQKTNYYNFTRALAGFQIAKTINIVITEYMYAMNDPVLRCEKFMIKKDGKVIVPVVVLDFPGDPIDIPVTSLGNSFLPMDITMGFGVWPPHSPLGWIYRAIDAVESLKMPSLVDMERLRAKEGFENKKKTFDRLCIDVDQLREENASRTRENEARAEQMRISLSNTAKAKKAC